MIKQGVVLKKEYRFNNKIILKPGEHKKLHSHWCEICHINFFSYSENSRYCSSKCYGKGRTENAHIIVKCKMCYKPINKSPRPL